MILQSSRSPQPTKCEPTAEIAAKYLQSGLSTIPIKADGTKAPAVPWKNYQAQQASPETVRGWYSKNRGIGVVCGSVSGKLEVIDIDDAETFKPFSEALESLEPGLLERLTVVQTPRPGFHVYYRCEQVEGNQKLAQAEEGGSPRVLIETRGEGGYVLAPGSPGDCHPTGRNYTHASGPPLTEIPTITIEQRETLFRAARSLDSWAVADSESYEQAIAPQRNGRQLPGDDFNRRATWEDILTPHGWEVDHASGGRTYWRRPGKEKGWSATTGLASGGGNELFCCFSDNAHPFAGANGKSPCTSYAKFAAHAVLNHDGDYSAAAKQLASEGYGQVSSGGTSLKVPPWQPLPVHTLPNTVAKYVKAASDAIGCDASFVALPLLCSLARAIGNRRVVKLKSTWSEPAILWAAVIGKSGTHKTPSLNAALKFLNEIQTASIRQHEIDVLFFDSELAQHERNSADWKRSKSEEPPPLKPEPPVCNRYITSDCTIEALAALLAVQFDGLLVARDELAGWLNGIAEYKGGKGSDLGQWLAAWSAQPLTVDRKTGATKMLHVPRAAVSLVGGIQPDVLSSAVGREHMHDGLCARLLMTMPPSRPVVWSETTVNDEIEQSMRALFMRLGELETLENEEGEQLPMSLELTPFAKEIWVEYYNRHHRELDELDDDLTAAWSKLEAYTARFALIFQLCSFASGDSLGCQAVDETSMRSAIELSDWFGEEAKRVYGMFAETSKDREQRDLIDWIERRGGRVTVRELRQSSRRYKNSEQAEAALVPRPSSIDGCSHIVFTLVF